MDRAIAGRGSTANGGRCYVLDITLYLLQMIGINNKLKIYNQLFSLMYI